MREDNRWRRTRLIARAGISSVLGLSLLACSSGPQPKPDPVLPPASAGPNTSVEQSMRDHFVEATAARDAVIAGKLDAARPALEQLAKTEPNPQLPVDWQPWIEDMKAEAARGATATTLAAAADSVAALGATCGECHRTTRGGVREPDVVGGYQHGDQTGLEEKMARHQFSADELWRGLTGPVHQAWAQGAAALMNIRIPGLVTLSGEPATSDRPASGQGTLQGNAQDPEPTPEDRTSPTNPNVVQLEAALRDLRELGSQADRARTAADKQHIFAQIVTRCGECHAQVGAQPAVQAHQ